MDRRWLSFLYERVPWPAHLLLIGGMLASATWLADRPPSALPMLLVALALVLFFICLRLMDECKDYASDCVAHPERPLPRGLIALAAARVMVSRLLLAMLLLTVVLSFRSALAAVCYALALLLLWLMYNEFFVARRLNASPLAYAASHQLVALPLALACCLALDAEPRIDAENLGWSLLVSSGFFLWELGRKLWLQAARADVPSGYLPHYGWRVVVAASAALLALGVAGNALSGGGALVSFAQALFAIAVLLLRVLPGARVLAAPLATLTLAASIWGPVLVLLDGVDFDALVASAGARP